MLSTRTLLSLIGACAVAIVLTAPRVTHADSVDQQPAVAVRFGDLDLNTDSGVQTLLHRIQIAADKVCERYARPGSILPATVHQSCVRAAIQDAVLKIDSTPLTAYYKGRQRHSFLTSARNQ